MILTQAAWADPRRVFVIDLENLQAISGSFPPGGVTLIQSGKKPQAERLYTVRAAGRGRVVRQCKPFSISRANRREYIRAGLGEKR